MVGKSYVCHPFTWDIYSTLVVGKSYLVYSFKVGYIVLSEEYFTLPHTFRADPSGFRAESERNGRNGRNLVGMTSQ